ncbi:MULTISPECIES: putative quinol monooxygenase [unclassified Nonomuraea]|uniref:putative quinol monooxygenase n=1 Tax=unclassified Nonomuraea TaxID=2593643 RepID=UPI0033C732FF
MGFVLVTECLAAPGWEDRLRTALEALIEPSLEAPGCLAYQPYADPNRPARMVVVEEWEDEGALARHRDGAPYRHACDVLDLVLARPVTARRLVPARSGS